VGSETNLTAVSARHLSANPLIPAARSRSLGRLGRVFAYIIIDSPFLLALSRRIAPPSSRAWTRSRPDLDVRLHPVSNIQNSDQSGLVGRPHKYAPPRKPASRPRAQRALPLTSWAPVCAPELFRWTLTILIMLISSFVRPPSILCSPFRNSLACSIRQPPNSV
jgi:hypothetical protein